MVQLLAWQPGVQGAVSNACSDPGSLPAPRPGHRCPPRAVTGSELAYADLSYRPSDFGRNHPFIFQKKLVTGSKKDDFPQRVGKKGVEWSGVMLRLAAE